MRQQLRAGQGTGRRLLSGAALLCLLGGLLASAALAAPSWLPPIDLSAPSPDVGAPRVAVDPAGTAVAVWSRFDGTDYRVQAASKPVGGAWGAPVDLSLPGQNADEADLALDQAGNAVAVWNRSNGANIIVQARRDLGRGDPPVDGG